MLPFLPVPAIVLQAPSPNPPSASMTKDQLLDTVEQSGVRYFWENASPETGLVLDRANNFKSPDLSYSAASIAAVGFGLAALVTADQHGWLPHDAVMQRIRVTLKTFLAMPNVHGFFYHFVDPHTGARVNQSELSDIDTTLFLTGALTAARAYPNTDIERMANELYDRVDWPWMTDKGSTLRMGWSPESGFIDARWDHYDESSAMYVLAIGSPTHPLPPSAWQAVDRHLVTQEGHTFLDSPSLFTHQYSHLYVDFRHMSVGSLDLWRSSTEAALAQRQYAIRMAWRHAGYGPDAWGITACDGPDGYQGYGMPSEDSGGEDDGTLAPTAALGCYQFTPELSYRVLRHMAIDLGEHLWGRYGLVDAYNLDRVWYDTDVLGIDQGPEVLSVENNRTGLIWRLFMSDPDVQRGLRRIGFH